MKKILLLVITALVAVSTSLSLEPMKIGFFYTGATPVDMHVQLADKITNNIFVGETYATLTANQSGIVVIEIKDHAGANGDWSGVSANSITTDHTVDIYIGTTVYAQYRLDGLILNQAQTTVFDNDGNFNPPKTNSTLGTDENRWRDAFVSESSMHIGPTDGDADDEEMILSYDVGSNSGSITIDSKVIMIADEDVTTFKNLVSQDIGNGNTGFGKDALDGSMATNVTALGENAAKGNTGNDLTAIGYNAAEDNTRKQVTAVGHAAGKTNTGEQLTAVGVNSGRNNKKDDLTAIGYNAGNDNDGENVTVVGAAAGRDNEGDNVTGIGENAAKNNTADNVVAIGVEAGDGNGNSNVILIGNSVSATANNQVVIGNSAITETQLTGNVIPRTDNTQDLGSATKQWKDLHVKGNILLDSKGISVLGASNAISFGKSVDAHQTNETTYGMNAGQGNTASNVTVIGANAGTGNNQSNLTALGANAGQSNSGLSVTVVGNNAGQNNTDFALTAIGNNAGQTNTGTRVTVIGNNAGKNNSGTDVVAIGNSAGENNTKSNVTILTNASLPSYANRTAAVASLMVNAIVGNTYLYYNETTFAIEGYRP